MRVQASRRRPGVAPAAVWGAHRGTSDGVAPPPSLWGVREIARYRARRNVSVQTDRNDAHMRGVLSGHMQPHAVEGQTKNVEAW